VVNMGFINCTVVNEINIAWCRWNVSCGQNRYCSPEVPLVIFLDLWRLPQRHAALCNCLNPAISWKNRETGGGNDISLTYFRILIWYKVIAVWKTCKFLK
jgi:hypothetical protein